MSMSKKDYIRFAHVFREERDNPKCLQFCRALLDSLIVKFANIFKADNPRFDFGKFTQATNYKQDPTKKGDDDES